jgi:DNA-directed RNA polymerase subunit M
MQFCPECKAFCIVEYETKQAVCSKCGHIVEIESFQILKNQKEKKENIVVANEKVRQINVLPRVKRKCRKCGNNEAIVRILASRSEEDYEEECYSCTKCGHTWRDQA